MREQSIEGKPIRTPINVEELPVPEQIQADPEMERLPETQEAISRPVGKAAVGGALEQRAEAAA